MKLGLLVLNNLFTCLKYYTFELNCQKIKIIYDTEEIVQSKINKIFSILIHNERTCEYNRR